MSITTAALNRATLQRQLLLEPSTLSTVAAVEHLVGLQAQAPFPPYTGLWTRLARFDPDELGALLLDRAVVRTVLMRGTVHLVSARDCLAIRPVLQPSLLRHLQQAHGKELAGLDLDDVAAHGFRLLHDTTPTTAELGRLLAAEWPDYPPTALANVLRNRLTLVQVPPRAVWGRSGATRVTTVEAWLGSSVDADADPAPLVRRYLAAFGPASVADIQKWCGLTRLREVVERMGVELMRLRGPDDLELFDLPDAPRPDPDVPAPVRFLPQFDNVLLSHVDTTRIVDNAFKPALFTRNGIIPGTVLVDGRVQAVWALTKTPGAATVEVTPFRRLTAAERTDVIAEGTRMLAFAAADAATREVHIPQQ